MAIMNGHLTRVSLELEDTRISLQPDPMGTSLEVRSIRASQETEATGAGLALRKMFMAVYWVCRS